MVTNKRPGRSFSRHTHRGMQSELSGAVDCLQHAVDSAHAAGMHRTADKLDGARSIVAGVAFDLWGKGGAV